MPAKRSEWAAAFAQQALSGWRVFEHVLAPNPDVELCHRLHYLQMASEKIAKAYRLRDTRVALDEAMSQHVALTKFVRSYLSAPLIRERYRGRAAQLQQLVASASLLAREIERLAPAVDRERSPANAEYPWLVGNEVRVPCRDTYPNLAKLASPHGRSFLKYLRQAITEFDTTTIA